MKHHHVALDITHNTAYTDFDEPIWGAAVLLLHMHLQHPAEIIVLPWAKLSSPRVLNSICIQLPHWYSGTTRFLSASLTFSRYVCQHPLNMEIKVDIVGAYMLGVFPLFVGNLPSDGILSYHVSLCSGLSPTICKLTCFSHATLIISLLSSLQYPHTELFSLFASYLLRARRKSFTSFDQALIEVMQQSSYRPSSHCSPPNWWYTIFYFMFSVINVQLSILWSGMTLGSISLCCDNFDHVSGKWMVLFLSWNCSQF